MKLRVRADQRDSTKLRPTSIRTTFPPRHGERSRLHLAELHRVTIPTHGEAPPNPYRLISVGRHPPHPMVEDPTEQSVYARSGLASRNWRNIALEPRKFERLRVPDAREPSNSHLPDQQCGGVDRAAERDPAGIGAGGADGHEHRLEVGGDRELVGGLGELARFESGGRWRHVQGFLFGRHGHNREHLGPLVADSPHTAAALLESSLAEQSDRRFYLDAPDDRQEWRGVLSRMGFAIERPFLRMHRGPLTTPGQPSSIYAIAGPEFG